MTWTRTQLIELRNKATARAQQCAPIVQEAEELSAVIAATDELLGGVPVPEADRLRRLQPVTEADYEPEILASKFATQDSVLAFVALSEGAAVERQNIASALKVSQSSVDSALRRLTQRGSLVRVERGRYAVPA